ncbi:microsomal glutathione S-transferase 1-like [Anneissia japonica]|uniref:microsomal glutathione S-transferase 1-like n=1 Tax=Anneissia japonica TaxID=1529436 RepID=UPI0014254E12|nr:microsomal glutathione S-transferase 1-like [Anneissia japonica]
MSGSDELLSLFGTYATLATVKMMLLSAYMGRIRMKTKTFANPEDIINPKKNKIGVGIDEDIERVRRCHLNDLENIVPFLFIGSVYTLTNPSYFVAAMHFRVFFASRIAHSLAYLIPIPQPARLLAFATGWFTVLSMAVQVLMQGNL